MEKISDYEQLVEFIENYPDLIFDNIGYQYLSKEVRAMRAEQIKEIEEILKRNIVGFVEFNNFKPRQDGSFDIRCQYNWCADRTPEEKARGGLGSFIGVGYFPLKNFK